MGQKLSSRNERKLLSDLCLALGHSINGEDIAANALPRLLDLIAADGVTLCRARSTSPIDYEWNTMAGGGSDLHGLMFSAS